MRCTERIERSTISAIVGLVPRVAWCGSAPRALRFPHAIAVSLGLAPIRVLLRPNAIDYDRLHPLVVCGVENHIPLARISTQMTPAPHISTTLWTLALARIAKENAHFDRLR
jgi:hypothetical protein